MIVNVRPRSLAAVLALGAGMLADVARAEPTAEDKAAAESLFREGRALLDKGNAAEACRKLEESQRLDPAAGTQLNLAICHEREGKIATAWAELQIALSQAKKDGRQDREDLAKERIAAVEPNLPKLVILVPAGARVEGLRVLRNGTALQSGAWGTAIPVDPGNVTIEADAPGYKPWKTVLQVEVKAEKQVTIPILEKAPVPTVASSAAPPPPRGPVEKTDTSRKTAGIALGGAGVVLVAVGAYFGTQAISKRKSSDDECPTVAGAERCSQRGVDLNDDAKKAARLSNLGVGVGLLALGAGTYLYLSSTTKVEASASAGGFRASFGGTF